MSDQPPLILASSSPYRKELLSRLGLPFDGHAPNIDETRVDGETAADLAKRLAREKAEAIAQRFPNTIVIGSDQVAFREGEFLGKPGSLKKNRLQLQASSGKSVVFYTGICVLQGNTVEDAVVTTEAKFRKLSDAEIDRYVTKEPAMDCAGGFKAEALGISLFEYLRSDDPTALIGLPLIALSAALRKFGYEL